MMLVERLQGPAKELHEKLFTTNFNAEELREELEQGRYDAEAVNLAAFEYVDDCTLQLLEIDPPIGETIPGYESSHMTEALTILLDFGLDPNKMFDDDNGGSVEHFNIMDSLYLVDNGYQGADSLYLLLNHGGNPHLVVENISIIDDRYDDLWFDTVHRDMLGDAMYDARIHYTMVLIGFGVVISDGKPALEPVGNFDLKNLREHRNYYVGAIHSDKSNDGMELCFFSKKTNWEVARF